MKRRLRKKNKKESWHTHLCLVFPLFVNPISRLLPLVSRFDFGNDSVNLNLLHGGSKLVIEREGVARIHFATGWMFLQYLEFRTCK